MDEITYREFRPSDIDSVLSLFGAAFGKPASPPQWKWKYFGHKEASIVVVAECDGLVVGHYAILPRKLRVGSEKVSAGLVVDVMTHPDYGRRGIFVNSALKAFEVCRGRGISILYGFPNDAAIRGHQKVGWVEAGNVRVLARPLSSRAASEVLHGRNLPRFADGVLNRINMALIRQKRNLPGGVRIENMAPGEFVKREEGALSSLQSGHPRDVVRPEIDADWLRWRLSEPETHGEIIVATDLTTDAPVGALFLKIKEYRGMRAAAILGTVLLRQRRGLADALVRAALWESAQRECDLAMMLDSPSARTHVAATLPAMIPTPRTLRFIVRSTVEAGLPPEATDIRRWHIGLIDHDVI